MIQLAKQKANTMDMVAKMKQLVPEFVSNNSVFAELDKKQEEGNVVAMKVG
ncbi:hypothetical protein D3C72_2556270 [compost metagenome]